MFLRGMYVVLEIKLGSVICEQVLTHMLFLQSGGVYFCEFACPIYVTIQIVQSHIPVRKSYSSNLVFSPFIGIH